MSFRPLGTMPDRPLNSVALRLGWLALLPFVAGALLVWTLQGDAPARLQASAALSGYAAVVVSFIGGIHWGFGFRQDAPASGLFIWGVVPALVAWAALMLQPNLALVVHGVLIGVCYSVDRVVYPGQGAGAWLGLRFRLSLVAGLSCFAGAAGS